MKSLPALFAFVGTLLAAVANGAGSEAARERFVYEMPSRPSAVTVLRAVEKHIATEGGRMDIAVVAHGGGVEALLAGAKDERGEAYGPIVERLAARGVDFAVCGATLRMRGISPARVLPQGRIVDGGNAELARLARDGYIRLN
jgi:intracellular sulfur oxidation DsrE/DsrF family protein